MIQSPSWPGLSRPSTSCFIEEGSRGCPTIGERSDAVLRTAMAGHDGGEVRALSQSSIIGRRTLRLEDEPLLRGKGRFVDDITAPGVLHVAFVRSPHPHALIRSIHKDAALALPGVHAVLTLDDLAKVMSSRRMLRHSNSGMPLGKAWMFALADGEVSYVGEPVAMVVADSRYVAEDAA